MAPDASKSRLGQVVDDQSDFAFADLGSDQIIIDDVVYSLKDFCHPGGDQIHLFGGNDVTVQYRMIHPHHTSVQLTKLTAVRKLQALECEYEFNTPFERELKAEVFKIVRRGKEFGTTGFFVRAFLYIALYFFCLGIWIMRGSSFPLAFAFGLAHALIGLNVQHDANHGAASRKPWINDLLGFGTDIMGGSKWLWMEQHWTHHSYTNHDKKDPDIRSGEPLMILVDYPVGHPKRRWYHMFQAFFALPLLSLYWLSVVFSFDIIDLKHAGAVAAGMNFENEFVVARRKYARLTRLLYAAFVIYPPFYHHGLKWTPFFHLIAMGAFGSIFISVLFIISHNFESVQRNPMSEARAHGKKVDWYKMQVETSCTYGGFLSGCLTGGLNFQIEHHLFPRMSSAWYPYISPTVREVCKKHGVKYVYYPWIWQNIISTVKHIHSTGNRATETKKSA